jgi:uncharacterized protein
MDVTPLIREGAQVIQSYAMGTFRVSGKVYEGAILVTPTQTIPWNASTPLKTEAFGPVMDLKDSLDVVLLGTGKTMQFLAPDVRKALKEQGLSVDSMDTGAACRTYNVLMAEGRRVAAVLLPFSG